MASYRSPIDASSAQEHCIFLPRPTNVVATREHEIRETSTHKSVQKINRNYLKSTQKISLCDVGILKHLWLMNHLVAGSGNATINTQSITCRSHRTQDTNVCGVGRARQRERLSWPIQKSPTSIIIWAARVLTTPAKNCRIKSPLHGWLTWCAEASLRPARMAAQLTLRT